MNVKSHKLNEANISAAPTAVRALPQASRFSPAAGAAVERNTAMRRFEIKVCYKLFHHRHANPFAKCTAAVRGNRITLSGIAVDEEQLRQDCRGGIVYDWTLKNFRKLVVKQVRSLLSDEGMRYPIRWNDDTCLECSFNEV